MRSFVAVVVLILLSGNSASAQNKSLEDSLRSIAKEAGGVVGVSGFIPGRNEVLSSHGEDHFPMESVFKFPLAIKILHDADAHKLSLDEKIHIGARDWAAHTWSPMRDHYHSQTVDVSIREILGYTVSESDNIGCDLLFRRAGGTNAVNDFIHQSGIKNIAITATEAQMAAQWEVQYRNWCTPNAMADLLKRFLRGSLLSPANNKLLMELMTATSTGPHRIRGLLPAGTPVAHKTGSSGTNEKGITAGTNDAGIITLPRGQHLILVVFVRDSPAEEKVRERVIARIASAVWSAYNKP